jgi:hypothetical protein
MQKTAQRRGILNKLREKTNLGGIAAENFFTPEFRELMDQLRDGTDDPVRAILSGTQIGNASPPDDAISLKDLLKDTKSAINRREYMKAVANLGRFHKKLFEATKILSGFKTNVDGIHEKFLFEGLDDDSKKHLHDLKGRIGTKAASTDQKYFIKEANIMDFFANIGTERGRALAAWEKRYPKQVGKLKNDTISMLKRSESLMTNVLSILKDMATARATRNVDKYLLGADKIVKLYSSYDIGFKEYYNANVKGFLEKQNLISDTPVENPISPEVPAGPDSIRPSDNATREDFSPAPGSSPGSSSRSNTLPSAGNVPAGLSPEGNAQVGESLAPDTEVATGPDTEVPPDTDRTGVPEFKSDTILNELIKKHNLPSIPMRQPGAVVPARPYQQQQGPAGFARQYNPSAPVAPAPKYMGQSSDTIPASKPSGMPPARPTIPGVAPEASPVTIVPNRHPSIIPPGRVPTLIPNDAFGPPEEAPRQDVRKAHQSFYKTLETLGQTESPTVLSMYIRKYAATIQHKDLVTALKLFELAKSIKE